MPLTNHELHDRVAVLIERAASNARPLRDYLGAARRLLAAHATHASIAPEEFLQVLEDALTASPGNDPPPPDEPLPFEIVTFDEVMHLLAEQITDLREMEHGGQLEDKFREFGLDSPRGNRWYNFSPAGFLECAAAGTWDGAIEADFARDPSGAGDRHFVIENDGSTRPLGPADLDSGVFSITQLDWEMVGRFFWNGQNSE